jgi:putative ABC transport system permease protein
MWLISLRDLQWRRRRFLVAVLATALVFAMTLVLEGVSASWHNEIRRTVSMVGADGWAVPDNATGPFTLTSAMPQERVDNVATAPGVQQADPLVVARGWVAGHSVTDVGVIGYRPGGLGTPRTVAGRAPGQPGEVAVNERLHHRIGSTINLSGIKERVVGKVRGISAFAGTPTVFVVLVDAQTMAFGGKQLVSTVVTRGRPLTNPPGLKLLDSRAARADLARPLKSAAQTLVFLTLLLWLVAAGIVGSITYLTGLDRMRDFAACKAVGINTSRLGLSLGLQALVLAGSAAGVAVLLARVIQPRVPSPVEVPTGSVALLPVVAVAVALVASAAPLRRAATVDPALAFTAP